MNTRPGYTSTGLAVILLSIALGIGAVTLEHYLTRPVETPETAENPIDDFSETLNTSQWESNVSTRIGPEMLAFDNSVLISLDTRRLITSAEMRPDCSDIRLTESNGIMFPYWIEGGCNTDNTRIWAHLPRINTTITVYLYYGNLEADDRSSADATFPTTQTLNYREETRQYAPALTISP